MGQNFKQAVMNICIAGYYFTKDLINNLHSAAKKHKIHFVCHQSPNGTKLPSGVHATVIPNIGLEFHAYNHYLNNIWAGGKTLFMHDDVYVDDPAVFDSIENVDVDCAYLFRDNCESRANGGKHGRLILMSQRFMDFVKNFECDCEWCKEKPDPHNSGSRLPKLSKHSGFWYDPNNFGHVSGKPPIGVRHYNSAIEHFHWFLGRVRDRRCGSADMWPCPTEKFDVVNRLHFSDLIAGRRNCWKHVEREIAAYRLAKS